MQFKKRLISTLHATGLEVLIPVVRLATNEEPAVQTKRILTFIVLPLVAFGFFLMLWNAAATSIVTKYGTLPTPAQVWAEAGALLDAHNKSREAQRAFYAEQQVKAAQQAAEAEKFRALAAAATDAGEKARLEKKAVNFDKMASASKIRRFSEGPTYIDQIFTSLKTVFTGFFIASLIAVPLGILCGLNKAFMAAASPMIQIFKPVSPLAWLPIVMIVVGALYTTEPKDAWFEKSFLTSAITVALCSLWPTLINTALGVSSIERDYLNVAKVLKLGWFTQIRKIVIPSALPLIFTGLRLSLGVGWMVLIAAEMLAQNPGLGKFVWDMFQNGSNQTLAQIMVAVFTIGLIGFMLDRLMIVLQRSVSYEAAPV